MPGAAAWHRFGLTITCMVALHVPATGNAALSARDLDTQSLEQKVADDPRAAYRESGE